MLGGLYAARNNCRDMDDESPDDASGIVGNCSVYKFAMCVRCGECVVRLSVGDLSSLHILVMPRCRRTRVQY